MGLCVRRSLASVGVESKVRVESRCEAGRCEADGQVYGFDVAWCSGEIRWKFGGESVIKS